MELLYVVRSNKLDTQTNAKILNDECKNKEKSKGFLSNII